MQCTTAGQVCTKAETRIRFRWSSSELASQPCGAFDAARLSCLILGITLYFSGYKAKRDGEEFMGVTCDRDTLGRYEVK